MLNELKLIAHHLFMYLISKFGVVKKGILEQKLATCFFSFLVLSAIITLDGSGISMALLTIPFIALYGVGTIISNKTGIITNES